MYNDVDMLYIYVYVPTGSINEPSNLKGISHLLEHMLLKHSKHYSEQHMLKELTEIGSVYNAATDKDYTYYYQVTHISNYVKAIDIITDVIKFPVFTQDELDMERKIVIEEIKKRFDDSGNRYNDSIATILSRDNPYFEPVEGFIKTLKNITVTDLKTYFEEHYKNYIVCVNCDRKQKTKVQEYIAKKFKDNTVNFPVLQIPLSIQPSVHVMYEENKQYITYMRFLSYPQTLIKQNIILKFLNYVLVNSGLFSKIIYQLRSKQGLIYSAHANIEAFRYFGSCTISFSTSKKNTVLVLETVMNIINDIKKNGLSEKDLEFYKTSFLNKQLYAFSDEGFKTQFFNASVFYGHYLTQDKYIDIIKNISNKYLTDLANECFDFSKMGILTIGKYQDVSALKDDIIQLIADKCIAT